SSVSLDTLGNVAIGYTDNVVRIFDKASGYTSQFLSGPRLGVSRLVHDASRDYLYGGSWDGTVSTWELRPPRAIVVSGGGAYPGNAIAEQTNALGEYAYRMLRARGYGHDDILYLNAFQDG